MKTAIMIPARMESTRFPGKPLAVIGGKPLIEWTWLAAKSTGLPVYVLTPDRDVFRAAYDFGAFPVRTGHANNGTERCAEAAKKFDFEIIINWQGDAPLTPPAWALKVAELLRLDPLANVATLGYRAVPHEGLVRVCPRDGLAEHFVRCKPPFTGHVEAHVGLYAYRASALPLYGKFRSVSERAADLEQCRWLDKSVRFAFAEVAAPDFDLREVNYPEDIAAVDRTLWQLHANL